MKHTRLVGSLLLMVVTFSAVAAETMPSSRAYVGSITDLHHPSVTDPQGRSVRFRLQTSLGELRMVPTYRQEIANDAINLDFWLVATGQRMKATLMLSAESPDTATIVMDWIGYGVLHVTVDVAGGSVVSSASMVGSCGALVASPLHQAILEASTQVARDAEAGASGTATPHEGFLVAWLEGVILFERMILTCQQDLNLGGCSWGTSDWTSCVACCELNNPEWASSLASAQRGGGVAGSCSGFWWCAAGVLAGGVMAQSLDEDRCIDRSCVGMPGDPNGTDP